MLSPILCGGDNRTCLKFNPSSASGTWESYNETKNVRNDHTSCVFSGTPKLFLFGGTKNEETAELIGERQSYPITKSSTACAIDVDDGIIITGGEDNERSVVMYNSKVIPDESLPQLNRGRFDHACGSYYTNGKQVLVVAGGTTQKSRHYQKSSTEILTVDSDSYSGSWKVLNQTGFSLPYTLRNMASVSTETSLLIFGGRSLGEDQIDATEDGVPRKNILSFNGTWYEIGNLNTGRAFAAATKMNVDTTGPLDLTGCI